MLNTKSLFVINIILLGVILSVQAIGEIDCSDRENEEYQCGSACQTECEHLGEPCPIVNIRCNDACYCKDGYARDSTGRCIRISECPRTRN